jgi:hypothetical protein
MNINRTNSSPTGRGWMLRKASAFVALLGLMLGMASGICGDTPSLTEHQVKALFLFNFAKYTYWPDEVFPQAETPITIGVLGDNALSDALSKIVDGKIVSDRKIVVVRMDKESDFKTCQILFIGVAEEKWQTGILTQIKTLPVLTVGETGQFLDQGGIINFTKNDAKVRLEVDLAAARLARVQISAKLLSVADVVRGK